MCVHVGYLCLYWCPQTSFSFCWYSQYTLRFLTWSATRPKWLCIVQTWSAARPKWWVCCTYDASRRKYLVLCIYDASRRKYLVLCWIDMFLIENWIYLIFIWRIVCPLWECLSILRSLIMWKWPLFPMVQSDFQTDFICGVQSSFCVEMVFSIFNKFEFKVSTPTKWSIILLVCVPTLTKHTTQLSEVEKVSRGSHNSTLKFRFLKFDYFKALPSSHLLP